jgi:hypothetical protein
MAAITWRDKYKTLAEYYKNEFDPKYFTFHPFELEADPEETVEQMNAYSFEKQKSEYRRCALSFAYFATKYLKIVHPSKGNIPFIMFNYQRRVIQDYENNQWNIISKFRQGGLTTLTELWLFWRCLFKQDQQVLFLSKTDREATTAGEIVNTAMKDLPTWMKPHKDSKWNDHHKQFLDTGSNMKFMSPEGARGQAITYLVLDEAAFIDGMDKYWKAMFPTVNLGGNVIVISTVNGLGNWYEQIYTQAKKGKNKFNVIDLDYIEHPEYNDEKWIANTKANLGEKGWLQEVLRSFLGSGDTYIPAHVIASLVESTKDVLPRRKLFKKWVNKGELEKEADLWDTDGALWVFKEPQDGHDYMMGIDVAEGVGDDGDNSCIEVFDQTTLEQVAEFYSNKIPPYIFAQVVNEVGIYFNHALAIIENMGPGGAVLSNLQHELSYDNIYFEKQGKNPAPGVRMTLSNRPLILEALQRRLMNENIGVNSSRFVGELTTFIYDPQTRKAECLKGKHDDAIIAAGVAIYIRDFMLRDTPLLGGIDKEKELASPFKTAIYEEIKKEILESAPKNFLEPKNENDIFKMNEDIYVDVVFTARRRFDKLLREFSW